MSIEPPAYLASLQSNIRQRPIPWEGQVRSGTLSEEQYGRIRAFDKTKKPEQRKEIVESDLDGYSSLFVGGNGQSSVLESAGKHANVVQYVLVLLSDILDAVPSFASSLSKHQDPYKHLLPLLKANNVDDPTSLLAAHAITSIMTRSRANSGRQAHRAMLSHFAGLVGSTDEGLKDFAIRQFGLLLESTQDREQFWDQRKETLAPLVDILKQAADYKADASDRRDDSKYGSDFLTHEGSPRSLDGVDQQRLYNILLVVWKLSFEAETIGDELNNEFDIISLYVQLLRQSQRVKLTRVMLGTLRNVLEGPAHLVPHARSLGLGDALKRISQRDIDDQDVSEDLEILKDRLENWEKAHTTFDEYAAEVSTGHLRWTPPHLSEAFWKDNANAIFEYHNGELIQQLAQIVADPSAHDGQVLAIACNDIGKLVKEVPERKSRLKALRVKESLLKLIESKDSRVSFDALTAIGRWGVGN